jgi:phage portal protein BeeE
MSITRFTAGRLTKAMTSRSTDATFSAIGGAMRGLAGRGLSLIQGRDVRGYAVGLDGYTARMLDPTPTTLLGQLSTNELVYACMRARMHMLIQPAFVVERRQADGTYLAEPEHDLTALLRRPGPNMDAPTLWKCFEASYASIGRLYIEPMRTQRGRLGGLNPLNPTYMHEQIEQGQLQYYEWRPPDAPWIRYEPDQLIVRRAVDWADVPPMIAALGAVEADELSANFMRSFYAGNGVPSGII